MWPAPPPRDQWSSGGTGASAGGGAGGNTGSVVKPVRGPRKDTKTSVSGGGGRSSKQGSNANAAKRSTPANSKTAANKGGKGETDRTRRRDARGTGMNDKTKGGPSYNEVESKVS